MYRARGTSSRRCIRAVTGDAAAGVSPNLVDAKRFRSLGVADQHRVPHREAGLAGSRELRGALIVQIATYPQNCSAATSAHVAQLPNAKGRADMNPPPPRNGGPRRPVGAPAQPSVSGRVELVEPPCRLDRRHLRHPSRGCARSPRGAGARHRLHSHLLPTIAEVSFRAGSLAVLNNAALLRSQRCALLGLPVADRPLHSLEVLALEPLRGGVALHAAVFQAPPASAAPGVIDDTQPLAAVALFTDGRRNALDAGAILGVV